MRGVIAIIVSSIVVAILLSLITVTYASSVWPEKSGELCWKDEDGDIVRLSIENMGRRHYIVHGTYSSKKWGYVQLVDGNAEFVGNKIMINLSSIKCAGDLLCGSMGSVELDPDTLKGNAQGVSYHYEKKTGKSWIDYDAPIGLTSVSCPE